MGRLTGRAGPRWVGTILPAAEHCKKMRCPGGTTARGMTENTGGAIGDMQIAPPVFGCGGEQSRLGGMRPAGICAERHDTCCWDGGDFWHTSTA